MSGIEVYQSPAAPKAIPGSTRFAYRRYMPVGATPGSGYVDYWRGPGPANGLATSNQGNSGANFTYPVDLVGQFKEVVWNFTGFSSLVMMVVEQAFAGTPPLLRTALPTPENARLLISRYTLRWGGGGWASANSGHISGFWVGPASSASITAVPVLTAAGNGYIGLVRSNLGVFFGYKSVGGAPVLSPLPGSYVPTVDARFEHRLLCASTTEDALYRLFLNDVLIAQVSFSLAGTPRYAGSNNGVNPVICQFNNNGFDTNLAVAWRDWEVISGLNAETTL